MKFVLEDEEKNTETIEEQYTKVYSAIEEYVKGKWIYSIEDNPLMFVVDSYRPNCRVLSN